MDSGNSGSLQSSSGEDEFDSRADAISVAMMNNPRGGGLSPPLSSSAMFDSLSSSSFFDSISRPQPPQQQQQLPFHHHHHHNNNNNSNSVLNLDMATWSKTLRSDPNCTEIINNNSSSLQSLFTHQNHDLQNPSPPPPPPPPVVVPPENSTTNNTTARADPQPHGQRNPKKRSRASRRAPTTVLTTDTTNFRAMVQEFTGIPAPPFTASSSPFPRARGLLDLYGTPSTIRSSNHHYSLDNSSTNTNTVSTPSYLRRPFPQKVQLPPPPFLSSAASSSSSSSSSSTTTASPLINYHLSSSPPQSSSSSLFNVPNQILTSLLQSNNNPSKSSFPFLDDFGLGPGGGSDSVTPILNPNPTSTTTTTTTNTNTTTLSGLPGLISSDHTMPRNNSINDNIPPPIISWGNGIGSSIHDENDHHHHHQVVRGNNVSSDNAAAAAGGGGGTGGRGEGMMESWICSSD